MQLVYVWIKNNENEFIENKGFNFYGEHYFELVDNNDESLILKYEKVDNIGSGIFKGEGVENITAIVGENGSGKTMILEELKLLGKAKYNGEFLQVFKNENTFYYNTNISTKKFILELEIIEIIKIPLSKINTSRILTSNSSYINNYDLWDYTLSEIRKYGEKFFELLYKIDEKRIRRLTKDEENKKDMPYYFLNDLYRWKKVNFSGRFQSMCDLLFYHDVFVKEQDFLGKKKLDISFEINKYDNNQFEWIDMIKEMTRKNVSGYCELGRLLYSNLIIELIEERFSPTKYIKYYFYTIQSKESIEKLFLNKNIDLEIFMFYLSTNTSFTQECDEQIKTIKTEVIDRISKYLDKEGIDKLNKYLDEEKIDRISKYHDEEEIEFDEFLAEQIDFLRNIEVAENDDDMFEKFIKNQLINEMSDFSLLFEEQEETEKMSLDLDDIINRCMKDFILITNELKNDKNRIFNLLMKINEHNTTPEMKKYYINAINEINEFIEITKNNKIFTISIDEGKDLMKFISKKILTVENEPSFVLRQIMKINGLEMSSGERAMTNLFSWINTMPQLPQIIPKEKELLKENILLLIDEIDLYVHPEWQRRVIEVLCKLSASVFEHHTVQVVLTTHSPFILSDIPSGNIVYLKSKNDKFHFEDTDIKTFGANIYTLLKNSFFMESTMGEFSKSIITKIIKKLNTGELNGTEYEKYRKVINEIGESILKNHLEEKLKKILSVDKRIADLETEILLLRGELNDKN